MALEDNHLWRIVAPKLREKLDDHTDHLVRAGALDYADYKYRCGCIQTLKEVLDVFEEAFAEMNRPTKREGGNPT